MIDRILTWLRQQRRARTIAMTWLVTALGASLIMAIVVNSTGYALNKRSLLERSERQYANLALILAGNLQYAISVDDDIITRQLLQSVLSQDPELAWAGVVEPEGRLWVSAGGGAATPAIEAAVGEIRPAERGATVSMGQVSGLGNTMFVLVPLGNGGLQAAETGDDDILGMIGDLDNVRPDRLAPRWLALGVDLSRFQAEAASLGLLLLLVGAGVLLLVGAGIWLVARPTVRSLTELAAVADAVARNEFDTDVPVELQANEDEAGRLARALASAVRVVRDSFQDLRVLAEQVAGGADQIHAVTREVLQGSQVQSQAADETSSSMEEIAAQIITVAESAGLLADRVGEVSGAIEQMSSSIEEVSRITEQQAVHVEETSVTIERIVSDLGQISGRLADVAEQGEETVEVALSGREAVAESIQQLRELSSSMDGSAKAIEGLTSRTNDIGKVLRLIQDIADQTNILALNAAIEAARAGDAGRGFAVVADEVRRLAERSLEATREIAETVEEVQSETARVYETAVQGSALSQSGLRSADNATQAIDRMVDHTRQTLNLLLDTNTAMQTQMEASTGILEAVGEMNRMMEQVKQAMQEQATSSQQMVMVVDNMRQDTLQVANATQEQKRGGELVVIAIENISAIASENLKAMESLSQISESMSDTSEKLFNNIAKYGASRKAGDF